MRVAFWVAFLASDALRRDNQEQRGSHLGVVMGRLRLLILPAVGLLVAGIVPMAQASHAPSCFGRHPQNSPTSGPDLIFGTTGPDVLAGAAGDDTINDQLAGDDFLCGNRDSDGILGESGNDRISGGPGSDRALHGQGDNDTVFGDGGNDFLTGGQGNDVLRGGGGDDSVEDSVDGADTNDIDRLLGNPGNDQLNAQDGDANDTLDGGGGVDTCTSDSGDTELNCEA
jgi:Ca2+-binding RTX toxin-like protein